MTTFVICQDSSDAPKLRKQHLHDHLNYIDAIIDKVSIAGPLSQSDSAVKHGTYDGSLFIYNTDDLIEARQLFANDPYAKAGVYASATFSKFVPAAGRWIGGTTW